MLVFDNNDMCTIQAVTEAIKMSKRKHTEIMIKHTHVPIGQ